MKAMILAAGKGERMQPMTHNTPKPLIKAGEHCLVEHVLLTLHAANITEVVINISNFADLFMHTLGDGARYGVQITYSYEPGEPLGTGGGVKQALPLLGNEPFLLVSGDVWTDCDFSQLIKTPTEDAHLFFVVNPDYHPQGDYGLSENGLVNEKQPKYTYASVGIFKPEFFANLTTEKGSYVPLLEKSIAAGRVSGELLQCNWFNVGTITELQQLEAFLKNNH